MFANFNPRAIFRLLLALAIPTGLVALFVYSQHQANKEVEEYKQFRKEHPPAENITVNNYELKEVDGKDQVRWHLQAEKGTILGDSRDVQLDKVTVQYLDEGKVKLSLSAPAGLANESTKVVKLGSQGGQRVQCKGPDGGAQLDAEAVELTKKNTFKATGGVTILYPGVAKVTGGTVIGSIDKTAELKNFKILGGTHAVIGKM
jgi:hypothetical protein